MKKLFLVYGDPSAHILAANLVKTLKAEDPDLEIKALGSKALQEQDVEVLHDLLEIAVMGLFEVLLKLGTFKRIFKHTVSFLKKYKPDAIILIDYPGFNLRMAAAAKKLGIKVIYYVSPQIWAWHQSRIKEIKKNVDLMLVIFKFEEDFYKKAGVPVRFVGYPRSELIKTELAKQEFKKQAFRDKYNLTNVGPFIGILPGSRKHEIKYTLPATLKALNMIQRDYPHLTALLIKADKIEPAYIQRFTRKYRHLNIVIVEDKKYAAMSTADALVVCSGTSTLEVALLERPFIIIYKLNPLTYHIVRRMVTVPFIGMANILLGKHLIPELIQGQMTAQNIRKHIVAYLDDKKLRDKTIQELASLKTLLVGEHSFEKTAGYILEEITKA